MAGLTSEATSPDSLFGKVSSPCNCKSEPTEASTNVSPLNPCPQCGSTNLYRDGLRYLTQSNRVQRWLCRTCGYRFSGKPSQKNQEWSINTQTDLVSRRQICVMETKNLELAQKTKICARDEKLPPKIAGLVAQFLAYLEKEGFCKESEYPNLIRRLAKLGANLLDPESVKETIGRMTVKQGMKLQYVYAYNAFTLMLKIPWTPPKYRQEEIIPFIPDESELDCLITAARSRKMAAYLQSLKETFGDPSEVLRINWIDISEKEQTITINHPVKGHLPRTLKVSNKLLSMINCLPKNSTNVFECSYRSVSCSYTRLRKRTAEFQKNPRLLSIELRTFRHWAGTMIAFHTNGNVLLVKKLLGHKNINSSMKYIGMIQFKDDQFETATATTIEEIQKLGQAGWTKYDEITVSGVQMHFYKKPKRFSNYV